MSEALDSLQSSLSDILPQLGSLIGQFFSQLAGIAGYFFWEISPTVPCLSFRSILESSAGSCRCWHSIFS